MAVIEGGTTGALAEVDTAFKAQRASLRPIEALGWYSFGARSGLLTGVAANGPVFSLRNTGTNLLAIRRFSLGFSVTTAFTTAQALEFGALFATSFTASDSGGTALFVAGANKHRRSFTNITAAPDIRIASTAALTAGTRTLDTVPLAVANGSAAALAGVMPPTLMFAHDEGDYPIILAQNEGLVITNLVAMGAAGVISLNVNIELAEVTSF